MSKSEYPFSVRDLQWVVKIAFYGLKMEREITYCMSTENECLFQETFRNEILGD